MQTHEDVARKYRFEKLGGLAKRRRLSPSQDTQALHSSHGAVVEHKDILARDDVAEAKYGKLWLQRYERELSELIVGNARNLSVDSKLLMMLWISKTNLRPFSSLKHLVH